jgi:hypothetical protein
MSETALHSKRRERSRSPKARDKARDKARGKTCFQRGVCTECRNESYILLNRCEHCLHKQGCALAYDDACRQQTAPVSVWRLLDGTGKIACNRFAFCFCSLPRCYSARARRSNTAAEPRRAYWSVVLCRDQVPSSQANKAGNANKAAEPSRAYWSVVLCRDQVPSSRANKTGNANKAAEPRRAWLSGPPSQSERARRRAVYWSTVLCHDQVPSRAVPITITVGYVLPPPLTPALVVQPLPRADQVLPLARLPAPASRHRAQPTLPPHLAWRSPHCRHTWPGATTCILCGSQRDYALRQAGGTS